MTESEYLTATDPGEILALLRTNHWLGGRKARLFGCACVRGIWQLLADSPSRQVVESGEEYAEGLLSEDKREAVRQAAKGVLKRLEQDIQTIRPALGSTLTREILGLLSQNQAQRSALDAATLLATRPTFEWAEIGFLLPEWVSRHVAVAVFENGNSRSKSAAGGSDEQKAEFRKQAGLLRDIFGPLPFRELRIEPNWLAWNDGTVKRLAQAAYQDRHLPEGTLNRGRLAILADALDEAGCTDPDLLGHLRGPGPHVRGCFVLDLLLLKG